MAKRNWADGVLGNTPLSAKRLNNLESDLEASLVALARDPAQLFAGNVTYDANGAEISAVVKWPDGVDGTYSGTASVDFPGTVSAYTISRIGPTTKTYTQPRVTRDALTGKVTNRPPIVVTGDSVEEYLYPDPVTPSDLDAALVGKIVDGSSDTRSALSALFAKHSFVDVEDFRNLAGTDASDDVCIQKAIAHANANRIPVVQMTGRAYTVRKQINMAGINNVTVKGLGRDLTVITVTGTLADNNVPLGAAFTRTGTGGGCSNLVFEDFTVQGTTLDDTNGIPRRARTRPAGSGGLDQGFRFIGDLQPESGAGNNTSPYPIRNVTIRNVRVAHTNSLPWLLSGIRGDATVLDTTSYNTMDPGWIFNEHVVAHNLRTINGHDNGFSISRGNQAVTASNLYAENCAGYAVWIGGFLVNNNSTDYGSTNLNVTNISGMNCGWGGLYVDEAPKDGVISGIYMKGMLRGTAARDFGDDSAGTGIRIGGSPSNDLPNQVSLARNLLITGFVLIDCAKGGVIVSGATDVTVSQGLIINPGSATDYAGNAVSSTSTTENFGIAAKANSTSKITRFTAQDITVVDTRTVPLANYAIWMTGTADPVWRNVRGVNTRQLSRSTREEYREEQGTINYIDQIRYVTGIRVGQTSNSTGRAELLNIAAEPATVSGGGVFYVQAGALKYKGSSGTVTTIAPA